MTDDAIAREIGQRIEAIRRSVISARTSLPMKPGSPETYRSLRRQSTLVNVIAVLRVLGERAPLSLIEEVRSSPCGWRNAASKGSERQSHGQPSRRLNPPAEPRLWPSLIVARNPTRMKGDRTNLPLGCVRGALNWNPKPGWGSNTPRIVRTGLKSHYPRCARTTSILPAGPRNLQRPAVDTRRLLPDDFHLR
jgi:hypothetical protein